MSRLLYGLLLLLLVACAANEPEKRSADPVSSSATSVETPPDLIYVALGDSWPHGSHCDMCRTFAGRYADGLASLTGQEVEFLDRTQDGGSTGDLLDQLRDPSLREDLADADVVMISTGLNDLDEVGALDAVASRACGGQDGMDCLRAMAAHWDERFDEILTTVDTITGDHPVAVRLVTAQNVFLSDPTLIPDLGLPDDFARSGGELLTREQRDAQCEVAERHEAVCVDVWTLLNGPDHNQAVDENTESSHQAVADALTATGVAELGAP